MKPIRLAPMLFRTLIIIFSSFFLSQATLVILIFYFRAEMPYVVASFVVLNILLVVEFIIFLFYLRRNSLKFSIDLKNNYIRIFQTMDSVVRVIPDFLANLKDTIAILSDNEENNDLGTITQMIDILSRLNANITNNFIKLIDKNIYFDKVSDIINDIKDLIEKEMAIAFDVKSEIIFFKDKVTKLKNLNDLMVYNSSKLLYNFDNSTKILSEITSESNIYTFDIVKQIFNEFDKISVLSKDLAVNTDQTIKSFTDEERKDSLFYILSEAGQITKQFNNFLKVMEDTQKISDLFMSNAITSLEEINKTSNLVQDISERIKIISINVRIEASHLDTKQSGFKVLGKEISEFANLTSKISKDTDTKIKETINSIEKIKSEYMVQLAKTKEHITTISQSVIPFEDIIKNSFIQIKNVISGLYQFSNTISERIKLIIDKFQYQDITNQEYSHIIQYMEILSKHFHSLVSEFNIEDKLSDDCKKEVLKEILNGFNAIITTNMERKILERFETEYNVSIDKNYDERDLETIKEVDDKTFLF